MTSKKIDFKIFDVMADLTGTGEIRVLFSVTGFNGGPGKLDLRKWRTTASGQPVIPMRGMSMSKAELNNLKQALDAADIEALSENVFEGEGGEKP